VSDFEKHVLVTGTHRSGTTWVGRTLALHSRFEYVHEPFNATVPNELVGLRPDHWFEYVPGSPHKEEYERRLDDFLKATPVSLAFRKGRMAGLGAKTPLRFAKHLVYGSRRNRFLLKDPLALLSAGWMYERYGLQVVCMIRSPLGFVASLKKMGWRYDFRELADQELLMREVLFPLEDEILKACENPGDIVEEGSLLWNVLHFVILEYQRRYPSWSFVRYEDLAKDPVPGFRSLYDRLGLRMNDKIEQTIKAHTSQGNPVEVEGGHYRARDAKGSLDNWRSRLSEEEADRVTLKTQELQTRLLEDSVRW
jgi:hypothetical protein